VKKLLPLLLLVVVVFLLPLSQASAREAGTRIVGGVEAAPGSWPSQAALYLDYEGDTYYCGGTVIHPRWIITAAHCVEGVSDVRAVLGSNNRNNPTVSSKKYVIYPKYDPWPTFGDLALVELSQATTQPSAKVARASDASLFQAGAPAYIAGWGTTCFDDLACPVQIMLRQADINISDYTLCRDNYSAAGEPLSDNVFCAAAPGRDSCQGDSGGPLMIDNYAGQEPSRLLLGVVSWGIECADASYPGVYTDLTKYRSWIGSYLSYISGPGTSSLGRVRIKKRVAKTFTFKNEGSFPLSVTSVSLSGSSYFKIRKTTCRKTLAEEESCMAQVAFRAKKPGKRSAKLLLRNRVKNLKGVNIQASAKR